MDVIEELKRDVQHDLDCGWWLTAQVPGSVNGCDCSYRRKIAFLDRLREPTEEATQRVLRQMDPIGELIDWDKTKGDCATADDVKECLAAWLAAAQEGL